MSKRTQRFAFILQGVYVFLFFAFLASAFTVDILIAPPALAILRVPSNIRDIGEVMGAPWTQNLRLYHILLLITTVVGSLNLLGLSSLHSKFWRMALRFSSSLGLIILTGGIVFFLLPFIIVDNYSSNFLQTSILYASVAFMMLLVNIATLTLAIKVPLFSKKGK